MSAHRPWPQHDWDLDACCIHCGTDGADIPAPRKENTPPCSVHDEDKRARNWRFYQEALLDNPSSDSWNME